MAMLLLYTLMATSMLANMLQAKVDTEKEYSFGQMVKNMLVTLEMTRCPVTELFIM